jgi:hypothetical protein
VGSPEASVMIGAFLPFLAFVGHSKVPKRGEAIERYLNRNGRAQ